MSVLEKVGLCLIKWFCFGKSGSVFDKVGLFWKKKWVCFGKSGSVFDKVGLIWKN